MELTKLAQLRLLAVAGATAASLLPAGESAWAASVSLNIPSCTAFTLSDNGGGNYSLNCTTGSTAPGAPTGCVASATTTPSPLTSAGGSVNLAATCAGTTASTTWSWTRNSVSLSSNGPTASDTLPGNGGIAGISYSYVFTACNGAACSSAGTTVTVPGTSGGPVTPPGGAISCAGFAKTLVIDLPWVSTTGATRILTSNKGGFGANDAVVVRFTPPAGTASLSPGSISLAEWGGGPVPRFATLSTTACDFGKTNWFVDLWTGSTTISVGLKVGGAPAPYTAHVQPGTTYYLNIRNTDRYGNRSCSDSQCNMFLDFAKPLGT